VPLNSVLAKVETSLGEALTAKGAKVNELLIDALKKHKDLIGLKLAGVDFGVNNTAAIAFGTGNRALVISADRLEAKLDEFDTALDALVATLISPEIKELQRQQAALMETGQRLSRLDLIKLRRALKEVYANPEYRALRSKRSRWVNDYIHKLSFNMVEECSRRGVEAIVLGINSGWKDGMNMGRVQNRRFGNVPIARIIELIKYKAAAKGIVVVTTEESYTSKTSFVNNEVLRVFDQKRKEQKKSRKEKTAEKTEKAEIVECSETACIPEPRHISMGRRLSGDRRNTYVNKNQTGRWRKVHADVNGAFNIIRKVFKDFVFNAALTLKYTLMRVSARLGLTPIRI